MAALTLCDSAVAQAAPAIPHPQALMKSASSATLSSAPAAVQQRAYLGLPSARRRKGPAAPVIAQTKARAVIRA